MPAVAVVGGIAAAAGSAAGAAALVAGTVTLSTVAAGITFVSGVAAAIGGITGNKTLQKIGMIGGLIGGGLGLVGGLSSAGTAAAEGMTNAVESGGVASAMGDSTSLLGSAGNSVVTPSTFANAAANTADTAAFTGLGADPYGVVGAATDTASAVTAGAPTSLFSSAATPVADGAISNQMASSTQGLTLQAPAGSTTLNTGSTTLNTGTTQLGNLGTTQAAPAQSNSLLGSFGNMLKTPEGAKLASGVIGGLGQSYQQAQIEKERQRQIEKAKQEYRNSISGQVDKYAQ